MRTTLNLVPAAIRPCLRPPIVADLHAFMMRPDPDPNPKPVSARIKPGGTYDPAAIGRAQLAFALVVLTTIPAQDFRDVIGDAQIGRKTFPMLYPAASRILIPLSLIAWSMLLPELWHTGPVLGSVLGALGLTIAVRFWLWRHAEADRKSYYLYNVCFPFVIVMKHY